MLGAAMGWVSAAQPVLAVPTPGSEPYLGFVDGAVESVVLLVVEQTEIQRPQRGCKGEEMWLTRGTQRARAVLPLSTKGVSGDAEEQAAGVIKHEASCWEPCYETWLRAGRLVAIPRLAGTALGEE